MPGLAAQALSWELAEVFYAAAPTARLLNLYGSTEVAGDVTCYEVPRRGPAAPARCGRKGT